MVLAGTFIFFLLRGCDEVPAELEQVKTVEEVAQPTKKVLAVPTVVAETAAWVVPAAPVVDTQAQEQVRLAAEAAAKIKTKAEEEVRLAAEVAAKAEERLAVEIAKNSQVKVEIDKTYTLEGIYFAVGSTVLDEKNNAILDTVAKAIKDNGTKALKVRGHTDAQDKVKKNQRLSQVRADAVKTALEARSVTAIITTKGLGETDPVTDNETAKGRAKKRRINFVVIE